METHNLLLFTATVLPLIITPGPDMFFVASQAIAGGRAAGLRATTGVCLGYVAHSALVALGIAATIAASPPLFAALRWAGVAYLAYLAFQLLRASMQPGAPSSLPRAPGHAMKRGFLTALFNPKGMLILFAILPQFITGGRDVGLQTLELCAVFVLLCAAVYTILSLLIGRLGRRGPPSDMRRRLVEGAAGGILAVAAVSMALR